VSVSEFESGSEFEFESGPVSGHGALLSSLVSPFYRTSDILLRHTPPAPSLRPVQYAVTHT